MKFKNIFLILINLLLLTACTSDNSKLVTSLEEEIVDLKKELVSVKSKLNDYENKKETNSNEIVELNTIESNLNMNLDEYREFYLQYIDNQKYYEHTESYIYGIDYDAQAGGSVQIVDINKSESSTLFSDWIELPYVSGFEVSKDDKYLTLNIVNLDSYLWKLQIARLRDFKDLSQETFFDDLIIYDIDMASLFGDDRKLFQYDYINLDGYSVNNEVLWGSVGGEATMFFHFLIKLETGEVIEISTKDYKTYSEQYPLE